METPYLDISIVSKTDTNLSNLEILVPIKEYILNYIPNKPSKVLIMDGNRVRFEFLSIGDFEAMYEKDYIIYSFLYDEILKNKVIFKQKVTRNDVKEQITPKSNPKTRNIENYIVLKNQSNHLVPMRRNYNLIYKVNAILGQKVTNEEVQDGFLRFIRTKHDFETLFVKNDEVEGWLKKFALLNLDISHPSIQKFIAILQSYLS